MHTYESADLQSIKGFKFNQVSPLESKFQILECIKLSKVQPGFKVLPVECLEIKSVRYECSIAGEHRSMSTDTTSHQNVLMYPYKVQKRKSLKT